LLQAVAVAVATTQHRLVVLVVDLWPARAVVTVVRLLIVLVTADRKRMAMHLVLAGQQLRLMPAAAAVVIGVAGHLGKHHN
jgi:hypothetical protein